MTPSGPTQVSALDATSPENARATFEAHRDLWSTATVVGLGASARTVRELHILAHGLIRLLVDELGFQAIFIEGDWETSRQLDAFLRDGTGDPRALLAGARPFLASEEMLELVLWLRRRNEGDLAGRLRSVHGGSDDLSSPAALESSLAEGVLSWHERTGDRIVYLGGAGHLGVVPERIVSPTPADPVPTAGSLLRDRFGTGYHSVGLTFGSGTIPEAVPRPSPGSLEAHLDELPHASSLVVTERFDNGNAPSLFDAADRVRLVGPTYDPAEDAEHYMTGGDPARWFDTIIHHRVASSVTFLT